MPRRKGLRSLSHTLECDKCLPDEGTARPTGALALHLGSEHMRAMPAAAEQRGPRGSVGAGAHSGVERAGRGPEGVGPGSYMSLSHPSVEPSVPTAGPAGRVSIREPVGHRLAISQLLG